MKKRHGFLMIDALIGLVILSIAILAYLSLSQKTTEQTVAAQYRETGIFLAESTLAVVRSTNGTEYKQDDLERDISDKLSEFKLNNPNYNKDYKVVLTTEAVQNIGTHTLTPYTITVSWPIKILGINRQESIRVSGLHSSY